jgi:hypothetical protein
MFGCDVFEVKTFKKTCRFATLLAQFNLQKFVSSFKKNGALQSSRLENIRKHLEDKSLYALGFCSELLLSPCDTLLLSLDFYGDDNNKKPRKKAIFHHKACVCLFFCLFYLIFATMLFTFCNFECYFHVFAVPKSQFKCGGSLAWTLH